MQSKYNFIQLQNIILRNFSLYKKDGQIYEVNEQINKGVYCLAGANGLGKTTFLNSINYGLTGIVLEPNKEVYSPGEIVKANKDYTKRYFIGRIQNTKETKAEIEIQFRVKNKIFRIIRNFVVRDELSLLEIFYSNTSDQEYIFKSTNETSSELNEYYQSELAKEIGFTNFDYFIFYQLYVLTFDENRRMIFWDDRASSNALAVAFNSDPTDAETLSDLLRRMEKHESNGRNARWQATQANNKIKELREKLKELKTDNSEKLESEFNELHKTVEKSEKTYKNIGIEHDTLLKKQSLINSELLKYRNEHARLFSRYSRPRAELLENTNILLSIKKQECFICGSHGSYISESIERNMHKETCPICNTKINETDNAEQNEILKLIQINDEWISNKNKELDNLISEIDDKKDELYIAEIEFEKAKNKLNVFTNDFPNISSRGTGNKNTDSLIEQYKKQFILGDSESKEEYKKRDKLKPEYDKLLRKIEESYKEARTVFVPIFKTLAKSFIGLDLNIQPNRSNKGIKLILELKDSARTDSFQLSESQRFFLDIALRMSLAIFLSDKVDGATMLVDTPEGSLDIAYESRVGNMFAEFATTYNQNLFMTANINASQLLLSLAEKCGKDNMKFRRMLDWTDLSDIQKEGENLFQKVYDNIEFALNKN